ncbi:hypothetical protein ACFPMF_27330 [Larkinella bovis]|uniref:Nucleotide-diphospho-sugar transferase domain-containing protein n=1 Tax=Larkinella bovis TaxID=683041 RepID=A0ABW0ILG8_9BACT
MGKFVSVEVISEIEFEKLLGRQKFIHRIKIALIERLIHKVNGNILYIDTDCFVNGNIEQVFKKIENGFFVMHKREFLIKSDEKDFIINYMHRFTNKDFNNIHQEVASLYMWNAGIVGGQSGILKNLFNHIYTLTDILFAKSDLHTCEQLAFSTLFQLSGTILPVNNIIYHYWPHVQKEYINEFILLNWEADNIYPNRLYFKWLTIRVNVNYFVAKSLCLQQLECNNFFVGYFHFILAFFCRPRLESIFFDQLKGHVIRHIKHLGKIVVGKVKV